ncbi:MBL fold metallo-hydrolase RNA specificity domain-containing protein [Miniphocaeibacter halophilus]|uniref:MBL fold metallo-hydrolase n=1 Tax=Miniphocaeibacter halophilus TaxID=2931922 RepID=A0AC61MRQ5_9FIRM|nr:MBL fold metallo-hydrolase [Miniphocaeibacter halophilus]QQK07096.1 MBL fold metallo-hydrolase [Miniphocaeibacter halophilus]
MDIQFLGAAKMVTGSNFLITTKNEKFIIDCGLFQGNDETEALNREGFKFNPEEIDFMLLTHAHIDHSGRIPLLVKEGFTGNIFATKPTVDLCNIMLLDSAKIQETDTEWDNKKRMRAGKPLNEPLYTTKDAENSLNNFRECYYDEIILVNDNVKFRFSDAGHILGSAIIELWITEDEKTTKLVFSGDLGMPNKPILNNPTYIKDADYLIVESTYGNTVHENRENIIQNLIKIIDETSAKGGTVIIPAFAVGRTQEIIYELNEYYEYNEDIEYHQRVPIYVDSPMSLRATEAFLNNTYFFNDKAKNLIFKGDNVFEFDNLKYISSVDESIALNKVKFPRVIISSSGMANAGRVRHHLKHNLWDENSAVVFVGYQAKGTLGRILLDGKDSVKILGEEIAVKASIYNLDGFSGHADEPMLLDWVNSFTTKPKKVFIVHGENDEQKEFYKTLTNNLKLNCEIPELYSKYELKPNEEKVYDEISKEEMEFNLYLEIEHIIERMKQLKEQDLSINFKDVDLKKYSEVKRNLNEIKDNLMDLTRYVENKKK